VHCWADMQSVHGLRCYDSIAPNAKCQRVLVVAHVPGCSARQIYGPRTLKKSDSSRNFPASLSPSIHCMQSKTVEGSRQIVSIRAVLCGTAVEEHRLTQRKMKGSKGEVLGVTFLSNKAPRL